MDAATHRRATPITCAKYTPIHGTKRCRHYLPNGACSLPDEFMCVEWLKANGYAAPPTAPTPPPIERDLFGAPIVEPPPPTRTPPPVAASAPLPTAAAAQRTLSVTALASFQARGVEVCLASDELGALWLVPAYTGADRQELSLEHAALLGTICATLPGARITAVVRRSGQLAVGKARNCEP